MLRAIIIILGALSTCFLSVGNAQKTSKRTETPNERFERKGGRSIKTKITVGQDGEITTETIAEGRDMRQYDQGGHFDCSRWTPTAIKSGQGNERLIVETARNFIWERWQNKKRGYVRLTFDTVDAAGTSHIFIEPDENGKWQIVWRLARWHSLSPSVIDTLPTIRRVERKIKNKNVISLVFKDAGGEEWHAL